MEAVEGVIVDETLAKLPTLGELAEKVQVGLLDVLSVATVDMKERITSRSLSNQEAIDFTLGMTSAIAKMN